MPQSNPPSLLMPKKQIPSPNFSELLLLIQHHHHNIVQQTMLSNKTFIYQAHPKLHHQNPMPQPGQTQYAHKQDIHLPKIILRSIIKTQSHNLDKQQCSQNKTFIYQRSFQTPSSKPNPTIWTSNNAIKTRHSSTKRSFQAPSSKPNATIWTSNNSSQSNKQERISQAPKLIPTSSIIKNPIPQIQHHHLF